jgi:hypothetical protein
MEPPARADACEAAGLRGCRGRLARRGSDRGGEPRRHGPPRSGGERLCLRHAAAAADKQTFAPPRDDQWIYTEDKLTSSDGRAPTIIARWHLADGRGSAFIDDHGALQVDTIPQHHPNRPPPGLFDSYEALAALPTDPAALLHVAFGETKDISGAGSTDDAEVFSMFRVILGQGVLPPGLESAVFRVLEQVPGVTAKTSAVNGRPALAVGQTDDWLNQELLLDMNTYLYLGQRSTVVKDAVINPLKAGKSTGQVKKGHWVVAERVATGVIDKPGEKP